MTSVSRLGDRRWLVRLAWATLLANVGIVLTGGAVRLTGSGSAARPGLVAPTGRSPPTTH